jgi:hypothetical protein
MERHATVCFYVEGVELVCGDWVVVAGGGCGRSARTAGILGVVRTWSYGL